MKAIDLFSGCGGLSLGFQRAGFSIEAAFDAWKTAVDCYAANFSHPVMLHDLSDTASSVEKILPLKPDMIIGGPPCQDYSHAGKRSEGERADLTFSFAEIVCAVQPKWFVMENVDRASKSRCFARARSVFKECGYGITERVLDASRCGVPQARKRFFCIGLLGAKDGFLGETLDGNLSVKPMTVRDYLGMEFGVEHYYRHPRNYSRRGVFSIDEPSPTVRGVNRPVPKGYPGHPKDSAPVAGVRPLTTMERARIQTFPADFVWAASKTDLEQMIGNAVPVNLAAFVAEAVKKYAAEEVPESTDDRGEEGNRPWKVLKTG